MSLFVLLFSNYERLHKNLQEKLQEIAVFYYGNRNYFTGEVESKILKLLNIGQDIQKNFEETKELLEMIQKERWCDPSLFLLIFYNKKK